MGWPPCRIGVDFMDLIGSADDSDQAEMYRRFKAALDPNDVSASGRYAAVDSLPR